MSWQSFKRRPEFKIPPKQKVYNAFLQQFKNKDYPVLHQYLLDSYTESDIESDIESKKKLRENLEKLVRTEWMYYHDQRLKRSSSLTDALNSSIIEGGLSFQNHYRCVFSEFQNKPLSSKGSISTFKGGRFNIGKLDGFTSFPGFYIANSEITAKSEAFQTDILKKYKYDYSAFALQKSIASHSVARINGHIEKVVNINIEPNLKKIVKILKKIEPSEQIMNLSKSMGLQPHGSVATIKHLTSQLFDRNPSYYPVNFGLPHNSQDFGKIARDAGIQGLLFKSKFNSGNCLVIFPENLKNCPKSFYELSDKFPDEVIKRIDHNNYESSYL